MNKPMSFYLEDVTKELIFKIYIQRVKQAQKTPDKHVRISRSLIVNDAIKALACKELKDE